MEVWSVVSVEFIITSNSHELCDLVMCLICVS